MVTIADIAREARVSAPVVSAVLHPRKCNVGFSEETRDRVLDIARRLGYRRNRHSFALRTGKSRTIGIYLGAGATLIGHPNTSFQAGVIQAALARLGYALLVVSLEEAIPYDRRDMAGVVVLGVGLKDLSERQRSAIEPLPVLTPHCLHGPGGTWTSANQMATAESTARMHEMSARWLYDLGHRDLLLVNIANSSVDARPTFRAVARDMGLTATLRTVSAASADRAYPNVVRALARGRVPSAVYAFDDDVAERAIGTLSRRGLSVPRDVSVFSRGTQRSPLGEAMGITGVTPGWETWWKDVIPQFVEAVEGRRRFEEIVTRIPQPELMVRSSCAPPRNKAGEPALPN